MFVSSSTKGAAIYNALIMLVLVVVAVLVALMLVKLQKDTKDATGNTSKFTLASKKTA